VTEANGSEQRVAIVTGGARGIGAAITTALANSGVHVAAGYASNSKAADELAGKLNAEGASVSVHQGNVGVPEDCQRVVQEVLDAKGRVDILVNNAGITVDKTMRKMTVDDWHAVLPRERRGEVRHAGAAEHDRLASVLAKRCGDFGTDACARR